MTTKQRAQLYHELAKLIGAGLHLDRSIELLLEQSPASSVRRYLQGLKRGLAGRMSLSEAITKHNHDLVSGLEISLVEAGERGGRLDEAFEHLAHYFDLKQRAKDKAVGALIYPFILLHLGLVIPDVSGLMLGQGLGNIVPQTLLRLGIAWVVIGSLAVAWWMMTKSAMTSAAADRLLCRLPLIGSTRRHWALARFCQVFQTGLLAALRMSDALRLSGGASQSALLNEASKRAAKLIEKGDTLAASMKRTGAFAKTFSNTVETAEESGTLDVEMGRWANAEAEMAAQSQDRAAEWLPRIFYVIVLLYVASRIIGMFSGYYGGINKMMEDL